jgi:hypothetical protein
MHALEQLNNSKTQEAKIMYPQECEADTLWHRILKNTDHSLPAN